MKEKTKKQRIIKSTKTYLSLGDYIDFYIPACEFIENDPLRIALVEMSGFNYDNNVWSVELSLLLQVPVIVVMKYSDESSRFSFGTVFEFHVKNDKVCIDRYHEDYQIRSNKNPFKDKLDELSKPTSGWKLCGRLEIVNPTGHIDFDDGNGSIIIQGIMTSVTPRWKEETV